MDFHRRAITSYDMARLSWSTQFNDLRSKEATGKTHLEHRAMLLQEIKHQSLFEESILIRDSDVVNSVHLLDIVLEDQADMQAAVAGGVWIFSIRRDSDSYEQVNEKAAARRADPSKYCEIKDQLVALDSFLSSHEIYLAELPDFPGEDPFRELLNRLLRISDLTIGQHDLLAAAIGAASSLALGERLRFGDIYSYLNGRCLPPDDLELCELIQLCRTAHILALPSRIGVAPTSVDKDLNPSHVSLVLGHERSRTFFDQRNLPHRPPRRILSDDALRSMTMKQILHHRDFGHKVGYFDAVSDLHIAVSKGDFSKEFESYLVSLEEYLQAISVESKIDLVDWEKQIAQSAIDRREVLERLVIQIPTVISAACVLLTHAVVPSTTGALFVGAATAVDFAVRHYRTSCPLPLKMLLNGTTRTPLKGAAQKSIL